MQVIYTGNYRESAVHYRGVTFAEGLATEVTEAWYELNKGGSIAIEKPKAKPKAKAKPKVTASGNND